jgi:hypothetical protein
MSSAVAKAAKSLSRGLSIYHWWMGSWSMGSGCSASENAPTRARAESDGLEPGMGCRLSNIQDSRCYLSGSFSGRGCAAARTVNSAIVPFLANESRVALTCR